MRTCRSSSCLIFSCWIATWRYFSFSISIALWSSRIRCCSIFLSWTMSSFINFSSDLMISLSCCSLFLIWSLSFSFLSCSFLSFSFLSFSSLIFSSLSFSILSFSNLSCSCLSFSFRSSSSLRAMAAYFLWKNNCSISLYLLSISCFI